MQRVDLRIVGVALLVSMDFHVPLFHHTYSGNTHDSKTFASVTEELVARYRLLEQHCQDITLVFDKGNNSTENLTAIAASPFHFVESTSMIEYCGTPHIERKAMYDIY